MTKLENNNKKKWTEKAKGKKRGNDIRENYYKSPIKKTP